MDRLEVIRLSLKSFIAKKAISFTASKATEILKGSEKATPIIENNMVESDRSHKVKKIAKKVAGIAKTVEKISDDVSNTAEIVSFQKEIKNLRKEGKITQDILDAILCENQNKLALAYREAVRAEAMGQPLKYLSEDEVNAALGFRKGITKAVTRKVVGKK